MNMVTVIAMKNIEKTMSFITPPVLILALVIVKPFPISTSNIKNRAFDVNSRNRPTIYTFYFELQFCPGIRNMQ